MKIKGFLSLNDIQSGKLVIGRALDDLSKTDRHICRWQICRGCVSRRSRSMHRIAGKHIFDDAYEGKLLPQYIF